MDSPTGLCFRCEIRARYWETGHAPRCECGDYRRQVACCYMFRPCRPVVLAAANPRDRRPLFGPALFSARVQAAEYPAGYAPKPVARKIGDRPQLFVVQWRTVRRKGSDEQANHQGRNRF
jgi:hypothetical protein